MRDIRTKEEKEPFASRAHDALDVQRQGEALRVAFSIMGEAISGQSSSGWPGKVWLWDDWIPSNIWDGKWLDF